MEITFIYKVQYCCDKMKRAMEMYNFLDYSSEKPKMRVYSPNKLDWYPDTECGTISYCPYCGKKIEIYRGE